MKQFPTAAGNAEAKGMRERFAGLRVLRIVPGSPRHDGSDKTASAPPLRWGRFFSRPSPLPHG
jgi:hypothetical protein